MKRFAVGAVAFSMFLTGTVISLSCGGSDTETVTTKTDTTVSSIVPRFKSTEFTDPATCGGCHQEIFAQWQGSMHNNAFTDQLYLKMHEEASHDTGGTIDSYCTGCHTPIGTFSGEVPPTSGSQISDISRKGVQCDFCHTVTDSNFTFSPGKVKQGPFGDSVSSFHQTAYSELHTKSDFCGMCHDVYHPANNLLLEATYTEWKNSSYAAQGIQCQDCHMTPGPGVTRPNPGTAATGGPVRPQIFTHQFAGGNATPLASPEHQKLSREGLQAAASLLVTPPVSATPGSNMDLQITVNNKGAGHFLPTGLTDIREMWLDIVVTDSSGKEIYRSGALDEHGVIDQQAVIYRTIFRDKDGQPTLKPWFAESILSDHRVPPAGSVTENYRVPLPTGTGMPLSIKATLLYRSAPQDLVDDLMDEETFEFPIIEMASASAQTQ